MSAISELTATRPECEGQADQEAGTQPLPQEALDAIARIEHALAAA